VPNTNYRRGARFEYQCRDELMEAGWFVIRAAGSHGAADLVALRGNDVLLIQCKVGKDLLSAKDRMILVGLSRITVAKPVLAYRPGRGRIEWLELDFDGQRDRVLDIGLPSDQ
jgi:Holliday junction resolvase